MAWERVKTAKPDLVVLDLMIPGIHGLEVCKLIRRDATTQNLPIIMLTAKSDQVDKILGLELGADDYITKPFNVRELIARIRAVLRRYEGRQQKELSETFAFQGLSVNFGSCTVAVDGKKVDLSSREFKLLKFFTEHPGRVYSRDQLLDYVWGDEAFVEPRTVDVHISRLRAAIEKDKEKPRYILTVRGLGYKFADLT
jgi:DNA-binding response OmpR family regulator